MTVPTGTSPTLTLKLTAADAESALAGFLLKVREFSAALPAELKGSFARSQQEIEGAGRTAIATAVKL